MQHLVFFMLFATSIHALPVHVVEDVQDLPRRSEQSTAFLARREPHFGMMGGMGGMPGLGGMMGGGMPSIGGGMMGNNAGGGGTATGNGAAFMAFLQKMMSGMNRGGTVPSTVVPSATESNTATTTTSTTPAGLSGLSGTEEAPPTTITPSIPKPDPAGGAVQKRQLPVLRPFTTGTPTQIGAGGLVTSVGNGLNLLLPGPLGAGLMALLGGVGKDIAAGVPPPRVILSTPRPARS